MHIKGFLVILLLVVVLVFFLLVVKRGGEERIKQEVDAFSQVKEKTTKTNLTSIERAIDLFMAQNGRPPKNLKEIQTFRPSVYVNTDAWGTTIKYVQISESHYRLVSAGKDKTFDTQDDIAIEN